MKQNGQIVALIPARGGSKGVTDKNLRPVAGRALIVWTIDCARDAECVDRVIVTTDDERIAHQAREAGAEVPFMRPAELARDDTPGIAPVLHALDWLLAQAKAAPEAIVCLQPTSPLRSPGDVDAAVDLFRRRKADAVVSVCEARHHPLWTKRLTRDDRISPYLEGQAVPARRQDLPDAWALNGAIFLGRTDVLQRQKTWYTPKTYALRMPASRSIDVDTPWDLKLVDLILSAEATNGL